MSGEPILLVGAGGHARSCIDVVEQSGLYRVFGLVDVRERIGEKVFGYSIVGCDDDLPALLRECPSAIVVVGQIASSAIRRRLFETLRAAGARLPTVVSTRAIASRFASIGPGTLIGHQATVNAGASVGANCIINSHALVEHDATIGDHCHISTGAIVNGATVVDEGCFVGSGAVLRDGIRVGRDSFIGAGALVVQDCPPSSRVKR